MLVLTPDDERAVAATEALRSGLDDARAEGLSTTERTNLAAAMGRVLAECGATPTLAATLLEDEALRAALCETYTRAREELRAEADATRWELPGCAVRLGPDRFAVCANPPHEDDAAVAWADRTAAGLVKLGARVVVVSGNGPPRKHLEDALALLGARVEPEASADPPRPFRFRFPWAR
jgi:sarcosine oxidase gamma subunit